MVVASGDCICVLFFIQSKSKTVFLIPFLPNPLLTSAVYFPSLSAAVCWLSTRVKETTQIKRERESIHTPMPSASIQRRILPPIHRFSPSSIQRLLFTHQLSSSTSAALRGETTPPESPSSSYSSSQINLPSSPNPKTGSIPRWVAGIAVGSAVGALFHSSYFSSYYSDSTTNRGDSALFGFRFAFADYYPSSAHATARDSLTERKSKFLFGEAFRRKIFFNYEKRLRLRSPPEKVFEYFASFENSEGEMFMTPADLMRAVVPVFPPSESRLVRDGYLKGEKSPGDLHCDPSEFFMLFDVDNDGLISFKEYIFFVTLLSIPESSFSVAFKMFDTDSNGEIDREEFKKVMNLMRSANRQGSAQRGGRRAGVNVGGYVENGGLVEYFFGQDGTGRLQHDKFVQFLRGLRDEILRLEFAHYDFKSRGSISAKDFALSMVASADIKHVNELLDRVEEIDKDTDLCVLRVSEDEFRKFAELRRKFEPFMLALFSFGSVTGLLTRKDFQRAATQVCNVALSDNVVNLIFFVFDANRDGSLCAEEFSRVLEKREKDLAGPIDDGILGWLSCCWNCSKGQSISRWLYR